MERFSHAGMIQTLLPSLGTDITTMLHIMHNCSISNEPFRCKLMTSSNSDVFSILSSSSELKISLVTWLQLFFLKDLLILLLRDSPSKDRLPLWNVKSDIVGHAKRFYASINTYHFIHLWISFTYKLQYTYTQFICNHILFLWFLLLILLIVTDVVFHYR